MITDDILLEQLEDMVDPTELVELLGLDIRDLWGAFYSDITQFKRGVILERLNLDD